MFKKDSRFHLENASDLHRAAVNKEAVELLGSLRSSVGFGEDDRSNATAGAVLVVGEHNLLDGACRLGEVFLKCRQTISIFADSLS